MDELLAAFEGLNTTDHESLVKKFSEILKTQPDVAEFFLEGVNYDVEQAINMYLSSGMGDSNTLAAQQINYYSGIFVGDLSAVVNQEYEPMTQVSPVQLLFQNDGQHAWPVETMLSHCEGDSLGTELLGCKDMRIGSISPGETCTIDIGFIASHTSAGAWRLNCSTGYISPPVWVTLSVKEAAAQEKQTLAQGIQGMGMGFGSGSMGTDSGFGSNGGMLGMAGMGLRQVDQQQQQQQQQQQVSTFGAFGFGQQQQDQQQQSGWDTQWGQGNANQGGGFDDGIDDNEMDDL